MVEKKCTSNRDNRTLERIVKQNPFKHVGEIHKEWTAAGVSASRTTTHRRMQDMGFSCRIPCVIPCVRDRRREPCFGQTKDVTVPNVPLETYPGSKIVHLILQGLDISEQNTR